MRFAIVLCLLLPGWAAAQVFDEATRAQALALRDAALEQNQAYALVESLSREVGPRLAGSPGDRKAVDWAAARLRELGFENVRTEPVKVPHWERGEASLRIVDGPALASAVSLGGAVGSARGGVAGEVLRVESYDALRQLPPEQVKGRIVFLDARMQRSRDGSDYGRVQPGRTRGAAEAARRGAVGLVLRSLSTAQNLAHTGALRYDDAAPRIPALAVSNADADALAARLAAGTPTRLRLTSTARYRPDAVSANVIGEIAGVRDEIVLLAAHLDSWDLATGANDDGAGVAIAIEAARLVHSITGRPQRTLRVVLYANEEFGLSGAGAYAQAHAAELDRHVLAMEADFGAGPVWRMAARVDTAQLPAVQALAALLGLEMGGNAAGGGADIGPLRERGVPVLEPLQDGTRYFDTHHSADDTLHNLDRDGLQQNVAVYAVAAYLASRHAPGFGRLPPAPGL